MNKKDVLYSKGKPVEEKTCDKCVQSDKEIKLLMSGVTKLQNRLSIIKAQADLQFC